MDFKKKLKIRLWLSVSYILIGIAVIVFANIFEADNSGLWGIGLGLAVCGVARLRQYFLITKNEETIRKQQIAESDERNIAISNKAKSIAFGVYVMATCIAIIVLSIMKQTALTALLGYTVCFLLVVYWISYLIIRKLH